MASRLVSSSAGTSLALVSWAETCAAIIPCYNEAGSVSEVVRAVHRYLPLTFVVDDGSTDRTAELAARAGARVLKHSINRGKGAALRTGLTAAVEHGLLWAVLLDGDGQHDPAEIPAFWAAATRHESDLVIGNRLDQPTGLALLRRVVNRWMSRRISRRVGFACPDSQCGFRLVRLAAWKAVTLQCDHYEIESEMLVAFAQAGFRIRFVPVRCLPSRRPSHIRLWQDTRRWFAWWRRPAP